MPIQAMENRAINRRAPLAAVAVAMLALMSIPAVFVPSLLSEKWPLQWRVGSLFIDAHRIDEPSFEDLRFPAENEFLVYHTSWNLPGASTYNVLVYRLDFGE